MIKKIFFTIGLIILMPTFCSAGKVNLKNLNKANWTYFETDNFNVLTDAKEDKAFEIVRELENFKFFLSVVLNYKQKNLSEKVFIIASKNSKSFKSLGMPANYAGIFMNRYDHYVIFAMCGGFTAANRGGPSYGRSIVFHELVHLVVRNSSSEYATPPWYNEGIAEYFSTYIQRGDKIIVGDMDIQSNRFFSMLMTDGKIDDIDSESLFKTTRADLKFPHKGEKYQAILNKFYAQSFMAVHYMLGDNDRVNKLARYLYSLKKGFSIDESFKRSFNMTFSELDNELNKYMRSNLISVSVYNVGKNGIKFPDMAIKRIEITKRDALGLLYKNMSLLSDNILDDDAFNNLSNDLEIIYPGIIDDTLQQQFDKNSENIPTLKYLAHIYESIKRYDECIDMHEKILLLDESDATNLNNYAWFLATVPETKYRDPAKAIKLAERAVTIERTRSHLDTLAEAYYVNGSIQEAIDTINEAISISEGNDEYLKKQLKKFKEALKAL